MINFNLTNMQREYLGLEPAGAGWDAVQVDDGFYLFFDGNMIRKSIEVTETTYHECEMLEMTDQNREILLPKTAQGRAKKLTLAAIKRCHGLGVYFYYGRHGAMIANYTTQTTYFTCAGDGREYNGLDDLSKWLDGWIADTSEEDLSDIVCFKNAKRVHNKFKEGDFFTFKIGRREYGFGRILLDINKFRKTDLFKANRNYGLDYMCKPLIIKVYHKISESPDTNIEALSACGAFPSQQIMDNLFLFGECRIIGNKNLLPEELDFPISYGRSISRLDANTVYLQYGLIYRDTDVSKFNKHLRLEEASKTKLLTANPYRNMAIGFCIDILQDIPSMKRCIAEGTNESWWKSKNNYHAKHDLRNPALYNIKRDIFDYFNLDPDASYSKNYNKFERPKRGS